jgi:hypothetical protein
VDSKDGDKLCERLLSELSLGRDCPSAQNANTFIKDLSRVENISTGTSFFVPRFSPCLC